jgi:hypothetical protein
LCFTCEELPGVPVQAKKYDYAVIGRFSAVGCRVQYCTEPEQRGFTKGNYKKKVGNIHVGLLALTPVQRVLLLNRGGPTLSRGLVDWIH